MTTIKLRLDAFCNASCRRRASARSRSTQQGVAHRYTAAYRLESSILHNHALFDKQSEHRPAHLTSVPLGTSFCQFVFLKGFFNTSDSAADHRLDGHPYQGAVVSDTGVPITENFGKGEIIGSLCHFDMCEQSVEPVEFELLQQAARRINAPMMRG